MMARWGDMMTVLVMGMVVSKISLVAGERCNLGQHREMQVPFSKPSIIDKCDTLFVKLMQLCVGMLHRMLQQVSNWLVHTSTATAEKYDDILQFGQIHFAI